ncbi:MAG: hypothetical protein DI535_06135 [Citrobacter freundii]|nr:MAG: hypothetical protein DI535_06135 [Citrobacter freundii]
MEETFHAITDNLLVLYIVGSSNEDHAGQQRVNKSDRQMQNDEEFQDILTGSPVELLKLYYMVL